MPAARKSVEEQYQIIMQCRTSGLSDYQWCTEHDINPGTFYNWVKRLRRKACYDIPDSLGRLDHTPAQKQEVVKVEIVPEFPYEGYPILESEYHEKSVMSAQPMAAPITIEITDTSISIQNTTDPKILKQILQFIVGLSC